MRVVLAGGGSGGHVTPLRAIAHSLQERGDESLEITVISDRAFFKQTRFLFADSSGIVLQKIYSGKFRRYHGKSLFWHLTHVPTVLKNLRDIVLIAIGIVQSISYFLIRRPDVVFCKGGYVCVPVGIAARIFKIPLIIHDSDTHPGLTNRFLSRWAQKIGTGMPPKYYNYPKQKMVYSGIPVQKAFMPASAKEQAGAKKALMLNPDSPVILITGGGTGAQELNQAATNAVESLLAKGWQLILVTGKGKSSAAKKMRDSLSERYKRQWIIQEFAEMLPLVKAADVVVSRAGATAMQEFANAKKAVVVVPSPYLTGGHQLKNAAMFEDTNAAIVLQEQQLQAEPGVLASTLESLVNDMQLRNKLATNLHKQFAKPHATEQIAALIANAANSKQ